MREFGGAEGLKELVPLLADSEPLVQREAVQGLMLNGSKEAAAILLNALTAAKGQARETLLGEVLKMRDQRAAPLCSYLVKEMDRGRFPSSLTAIEALGSFGVATPSTRWSRCTQPLVDDLANRKFGAPPRTPAPDRHRPAIEERCAGLTRGAAHRAPRAEARRNGITHVTEPGAPGALKSAAAVASGTRAAPLYAADHPLLGRNVDGLLDALKTLQQQQPSITIGIVDNEFVVADTPLPRASSGRKDLIDRLSNRWTDLLRSRRHTGRVVGLMLGVAKLAAKEAGPAHLPPHRLGRITSEEPGKDGIASDMAAIRQLYTNAVSAAEVRGRPPRSKEKRVPAALHAEGLADAVTQNRTALVALTAMRNYDNYTFTHMVNVSILTMGQARALGIEGRLLREFGLSALMHDIGKVRTPKNLQKPERL
jgi:hypothetical protein